MIVLIKLKPSFGRYPAERQKVEPVSLTRERSNLLVGQRKEGRQCRRSKMRKIEEAGDQHAKHRSLEGQHS